MAYPLDGPPLVTISCQPAGEVMPVGVTGIKLSPGIQANQNVPSFVVPVSLSVKLYWNFPGLICVLVMVAVPISAAFAATAADKPTIARVAKWVNKRIFIGSLLLTNK
jgi:hypothetical protein